MTVTFRNVLCASTLMEAMAAAVGMATEEMAENVWVSFAARSCSCLSLRFMKLQKILVLPPSIVLIREQALLFRSLKLHILI